MSLNEIKLRESVNLMNAVRQTNKTKNNKHNDSTLIQKLYLYDCTTYHDENNTPPHVDISLR